VRAVRSEAILVDFVTSQWRGAFDLRDVAVAACGAEAVRAAGHRRPTIAPATYPDGLAAHEVQTGILCSRFQPVLRLAGGDPVWRRSFGLEAALRIEVAGLRYLDPKAIASAIWAITSPLAGALRRDMSPSELRMDW
jgi:hypothetical protein